MVAMAAQTVLRDLDLLVTTLGVGIADVPIAASTGVAIDIMREDRSGPLLGRDRIATDIAGVFGVVSCEMCGARLVLVTWEVLHTIHMVAAWATARRLSFALVARLNRVERRHRRGHSSTNEMDRTLCSIA